LHEHEVEAEHARPARGAQVLPLVRQAHAAPGDPLVARQTRAQRRARRAEMGPAAEAALPGGPPPRRPTARAGERPEPSRDPRALPGSGLRSFVIESWGELKKVEWPKQNQLIQGIV